MPAQSASSVLPVASPYLPDISDYLGAPERRFFGEGYKRSRHRLTDFHVPEPDGAVAEVPRLAATAQVEYPSDWSRKGDTDQRPHLSTVDVLLLGAQLTEALLTSHLGLTEWELATVWLARVRIKAGNRPVEDDLAGFPVSAQTAGRLSSPGPAARGPPSRPPWAPCASDWRPTTRMSLRAYEPAPRPSSVTAVTATPADSVSSASRACRSGPAAASPPRTSGSPAGRKARSAAWRASSSRPCTWWTRS